MEETEEKQNNILVFPLERIVRPERFETKTEDEINNDVQLIQHVYINEVVDTIMDILFTQITACGFEISPDTDLKDTAFLIESLRSLLLKRYGIKHPFQSIANTVFEKDEDSLRIVSMISNLKLDVDDDESKPEENTI